MPDSSVAETSPFAGLTVQGLEGKDPYPTFKAMIEEGDVRFDEGLGKWVAVSYEACQQVFKSDKVQFVHPDAQEGADYKKISEGRRHPKTLIGEEHTRVHQWMAQRFSPRQMSDLRNRLIRSVIQETLDDLAPKGRGDLTKDFADRIPIRVVAAAMDLPWDDAEWIARVTIDLNKINAFYDRRFAGDANLTGSTKEAFDDMRAALDPIIEGRRNGTGDDIVSQMWRDGPKLLDNWNAEDVYINITGMFIGGYDTTTMAISNACKLLLDDLALQEEVRGADDAKLRRFVEEVLRLLPPVQYRGRRVAQDVEIAGHALKQGDELVELIAAANRDPKHYTNPDKVDLNRPNPIDHFTFIAGPRMCIGAGLARVEIFEAVRMLLTRISNLRYDPDAPKPSYSGLLMRRFIPINAIWAPAA